ncbi:MAG: glycosyltransferase [Pseudomonadales bacterium]|nr:glycosyltransferase [Pseudomonadales bacterium]
MKILLTNHHLNGLTGSEIFTFTVANFLLKNSNQVILYSKFIDETLPFFESKNVEVISDLNLIKNEKIDIAHVHHVTSALEVRYYFPDLPMVYLSHGIIPDLEQNPELISNLDIAKFLAVSEEVKDNLIKSGVNKSNVEIFRNIFNTDLFHEKRKINKKLKNVLVVSARIDENKENKIKKACAELNLNLKFVGGRFGWKNQKQISELIQCSDVVFSLGRGVIETMLSGRVPFVFDYLGGDGLITPENYKESMTCNFSGRKNQKDYSVAELKKELSKYNYEYGVRLKELALKEFSANIKIKELIGIYDKIIKKKSRVKLSSLDKTKLKLINSVISLTKDYQTNLLSKYFEKSIINYEVNDELDGLIVEYVSLEEKSKLLYFEKDSCQRQLNSLLNSKFYKLSQFLLNLKR